MQRLQLVSYFENYSINGHPDLLKYIKMLQNEFQGDINHNKINTTFQNAMVFLEQLLLDLKAFNESGCELSVSFRYWNMFLENNKTRKTRRLVSLCSHPEGGTTIIFHFNRTNYSNWGIFIMKIV